MLPVTLMPSSAAKVRPMPSTCTHPLQTETACCHAACDLVQDHGDHQHPLCPHPSGPCGMLAASAGQCSSDPPGYSGRELSRLCPRCFCCRICPTDGPSLPLLFGCSLVLCSSRGRLRDLPSPDAQRPASTPQALMSHSKLAVMDQGFGGRKHPDACLQEAAAAALQALPLGQ